MDRQQADRWTGGQALVGIESQAVPLKILGPTMVKTIIHMKAFVMAFERHSFKPQFNVG